VTGHPSACAAATAAWACASEWTMTQRSAIVA
jgi:hypothetical protein